MSSRKTGKFSVADRNYWKLSEDKIATETAFAATTKPSDRDVFRTLPCGLLNFRSDFYECECKPYLLVPQDVEMLEVVNFLARYWQLPCPSIVLIVISGMRQYVNDPNSPKWRNLQDGIIKAANTTPMWIITNGTNGSVSKMVGEAVRREEQTRQAQICPLHPESTANNPRLPQLTLIGIINEEKLAYDITLDGRGTTIELQTSGIIPENKFELNSDHTHFIIVKDDTFDSSGAITFTVRLSNYLINSVVSATTSDNTALHRTEIPVIGLFIRGGFNSLKLIADLLKTEIPILILKESGGASDFVSFAFEEIKEKNRGEWDPEYVEVFVKAELSRKIATEFPKLRENTLARNRFRERILECIRYSEQNDQEFLNFLDLQSQSCNFASLEREILRALFRSQKKGRADVDLQYDILQKDLFLILDWNIPEIALTEVFQKDPKAKFKVDKNVFEEALLRQNRENFLDLFLDQGFQIHKYLTERRLRRLFERAESPQFFRAVCWEEILGHHFVSKIGRDFVNRDLNKLIKMLTGMPNLVSVQELTSNAMGFYTTDPIIAERKAMNALIIWAVLMHRPKLVKTLWKRADQPIHLALIIGMIFGNLSKQVREHMHLYKELEDNSREFQILAVGVLDLSFQQNNCRAMDALNEKSPDWNYLTAVDIAALAGNETFICHPCCQKWLTDKFLGNFHVKELKWGVFVCPSSLKIILSAFFIIPIYLWIRFHGDNQLSVAEADEEAEIDDEREMSSSRVMQTFHTNASSKEKQSIFSEEKESQSSTTTRSKGSFRPNTSSWIMKPKAWHKRATWAKEKPRLWYYRRGPQPPLYMKVFSLWSAPITKFWTFQITYILYLAFFSFVVLIPSCGDLLLDLILWIWTLLILVDVIRRAYIQSREFQSIPVFTKCLEIVLVIFFLLLFMVLRIFKIPLIISLFHEPKEVRSAYAARVILCVGLLYFYFRLMIIYFPISPTLGPLLYRMKLMVMIDFMNFMRLAMLIIISSGIVIHAVIYPDYPMGKELFRRAFHRTWFSMFLTFISDLEVDQNCKDITEDFLRKNNKTCHMGDAEDYHCPTTGLWPYLMSIQYLVIMKLILLTLIYAMFSNTQMEKAADSDVIWKYQRYRLVVDFYTRLRLPPPLNIFSYVIMILRCIYRFMCCYYSPCRKQEKKATDFVYQTRMKINDYNYWRSVAAQYVNIQEEVERRKDIEKEQLERLNALCHSAELQISTMKMIKSSLLEMEKTLQSSRIALEEVQHEFVKTGDEKTPLVHLNLLSRQSPYPGTKVQRFLIADKYVPWVVMFSMYDPVVYTKPRADYSASLREFVDEDLLLLRETQAQHFKLPEMMWNISYTSGGGVTIDRTSWMTKDTGEPIIYKLDSSGLPMNPVGRTGLRGRGTLIRWGPNHAIYLAITKMRTEGFLQSVTDSKVVEFVISYEEQAFSWSLPGGLVLHQTSLWDVIRERFGVESDTPWGLMDMKKFFHKFAHDKKDDKRQDFDEDENFSCIMVQRDYLDDGLNTDNAWIEAEIWHIHYKSTCNLDSANMPKMKWRKSTTQLRNKMPGSHNHILEKIIHKIEGTA